MRLPGARFPLLTSAVGVLKTAPHPNAARFFAGWMGTTEGQKVRYETSGQANEVGRDAIGAVADKIKAAHPAIILETEKNFTGILEVQRELGKLLGALR
jgi:ABC-type Fe3+ transport system substrate-binding protein